MGIFKKKAESEYKGIFGLTKKQLQELHQESIALEGINKTIHRLSQSYGFASHELGVRVRELIPELSNKGFSYRIGDTWEDFVIIPIEKDEPNSGQGNELSDTTKAT